MNTTKMAVRMIAELCKQHGMRKVVFSPGSRSAPIYIAFSQIPEIECIIIPDERVAGYFALGMAQQSRELIGVVCTSGTAVVNLAPSYYEAYYQQQAVIYISADRPEQAFMKGDNQAIDQSYALSTEDTEAISFNAEETELTELNEQLNNINWTLKTSNFDTPTPAHINIYLDEPLYDLTEEPLRHFDAEEVRLDISSKLLKSDKEKIIAKFSTFHKKMIIVGLHEPNKEFVRRISQLSHRKDILIVRETTSNLPIKNSVMNVDACITVMNEFSNEFLIPEVVITMGRQIVSKKVKEFLKHQPQLHWDIEEEWSAQRNWSFLGEDIYDEISQGNEIEFLDALLETPESVTSDFREQWMSLSSYAKQKTEKYLEQIPFSDMKVFELLIPSFPNDANIQYGNSTPVRYSNLFRHQTPGLTVHSNRGTSGIDGCVSTAAGAAYANKRMTLSIVGDISFFYDSNALWNNFLTPDFRVIVINNSGGNIFRLIEGPTKLKGFEEFFETRHQLTAKHLAAHHQIPYYYCDNQHDLEIILQTFYEPHNGKPAILEIKTNGKVSAEVYKNYFKYLKQSS
ncbi:MAG: 2-succinyl-5-enolpyruvyl-6-hydroxy-3-cyclohexene-1-carboxylic-acid synthase [Bacteroidetes bacterium]|nr:2-succinyl-5-enolpyruvyl-6-hydroxy-3-cyclohexene-1-carboxylic-acid synthase [Bacteroidota bacterium]